MSETFRALLRSRKFLTLWLDIIFSLASYFVARYAAPDVATDVIKLLAILQPGFLALIAGITVEDAAAKANAL